MAELKVGSPPRKSHPMSTLTVSTMDCPIIDITQRDAEHTDAFIEDTAQTRPEIFAAQPPAPGKFRLDPPREVRLACTARAALSFKTDIIFL